ncbi:MAG: hypothetical protein QM758_09440 [Armatimonas sp.]
MPLSFAALLPHGGEIVLQLTDNPALMEKTRIAMREAGRVFAEKNINTVVVLDPHADFMVESALTIGATFHAAGILGELDRAHIKAAFEVDTEFVEALFTEANGTLPMIRAVGADEGRNAVLPLSWGALIPLWFTAHPVTRSRPKVVIVAPERSTPREELLAFGKLIGQVAEKSGKNVALIASGDLGHGHDEDGPYGFAKASAEHDLLFCEALVDNNLAGLLPLTDEFLEEALVDAFWQVLILHGALLEKPMSCRLLSYEAPTYFGMAVALFEP